MGSSERPAGYHAGELAVQERAGVRDMAVRIARGIHAAVPAVAATFLEQQQFALLSAADRDGRAWVSLLGSQAGFARAIDERRVVLRAAPLPGDPLYGTLVRGSQVGLLFIDFTSRRRMRLNGAVQSVEQTGITVAIDQVYANCPKYIQRRVPLDVEPAAGDPSPWRGAELTNEQRRRIAEADTFFVGTAHVEGGWDASHRGGMPGFVRVVGATRLEWSDYTGNTMFNTLGNIVADGRTGLSFPDFASGGLLQISGTARVEWNGGGADAERTVAFEVDQVVDRSDGGVPLMRLVEYSPFNPATV